MFSLGVMGARPDARFVRKSNRQRMDLNRRKWDESVPLHVASPSYDVPSFLEGKSTLEPLEVQELGSVRGKSLLHLQCHFGLDTLSWARRGASVTGVDFSLPAVRSARGLARRIGIKARFLQSNVYDLPDALEDQFDIVYTGKGALWWLPDVERWAQVVARFLRPGGRFFLLEDHPFAEVFSDDATAIRLEARIPYFTSRAIREEYDGTYATNTKMRHRVTYGWIHPVSTVLSALIENGLRIERIREYPFCYWQRNPFMTQDRRGYWHPKENKGMIPLMWSVTAQRKSTGNQ
jgi:SAM-dependent methyltransferase